MSANKTRRLSRKIFDGGQGRRARRAARRAQTPQTPRQQPRQQARQQPRQQGPKPRSAESIAKEKAGREAYAQRLKEGKGKETKQEKKKKKKNTAAADKAAKKKKQNAAQAEAAKAKKKREKDAAARRKKESSSGRGPGGTPMISPPSMPALPGGLPGGLSPPGGPSSDPGGQSAADGAAESGSDSSGAPGGADGSGPGDATTDAAAAAAVDPAEFGPQPPPYNAETCGNQLEYEDAKCDAIANSRKRLDPLFGEILKVLANKGNIKDFFTANSAGIIKSYGEYDATLKTCKEAARTNQDPQCKNLEGALETSTTPTAAAPAGGSRRLRHRNRSALQKTRRKQRRSAK